MKSVGVRFHPGARKLLVFMVVAAGGAVGAQAASAGTHGYFDPHGFYNCALVGSTGSPYVNSYRFGPGNRYALGHQHNNQLVGHIQSGRYALRGNEIVGLSGPLKRHHESLLIQRSDLLLMIGGRRTGIGCRRPSNSTAPAQTTPSPTPTPAPTPNPAPTPTPTPTIPTGYYSCKHTTEVVSGPGAGYYSTFAQDVEFHGDGTYYPVNSGTYVGDNHWSQQGDTVTFTSGPLSHDRGTWYPSGIAMPQEGNNVPSTYTLVIYDTVQEGGIPPSVEYSTTDGPGGSTSAPMSFNYCNLETPGP
jgi:hypothetical protein